MGAAASAFFLSLPPPLNVRGVDFDGGTVDEAGFARDSLILDGFVPVAMKKRSFLIMATTPGPPNSLFMNLIAMKDEKGNPKMKVVRSGQACERCMRGKEPWTCTHSLDEKPPWKDSGKERRLMYIYSATGNMNAWLKENMGSVLEDSKQPFLRRHIAELRRRKLYRIERPPDCVFLAVDSACGGKCEFAILAGAIFDGVLVLLYGDAFQVPGGNPAIQRSRIQAAVKIIRSHPLCQNVPIVHIPENAPGNAGPQIHEYLLEFPDVLTMSEWNSKGDTYGVPATDRCKQTEDTALALATGNICYSEDMSTFPGRDLDEFKQGLEKQALCWERVAEVSSKDPTKPVKWHYTAKHRAGNDDRIVTLLMLVFWPGVFYAKPRYVEFIRNRIVPRRMGGSPLPEARGAFGVPQAQHVASDGTPYRPLGKSVERVMVDAMHIPKDLKRLAETSLASVGADQPPPFKKTK